jgi:hypothetical protein
MTNTPVNFKFNGEFTKVSKDNVGYQVAYGYALCF